MMVACEPKDFEYFLSCQLTGPNKKKNSKKKLKWSGDLKLRFLHQTKAYHWATLLPFPQALDEKRTASSPATWLSS